MSRTSLEPDDDFDKPFKEYLRENREALETLAERDLPFSKRARELLAIIDEDGDH